MVLSVVDGGDTGGVIAAVLKDLKPFHQITDNVLVADHSYDATGGRAGFGGVQVV